MDDWKELDLAGDLTVDIRDVRSPTYLSRFFYPGAVNVRCCELGSKTVVEQVLPTLYEAAGFLVARGYPVLILEPRDEVVHGRDLDIADAMQRHGGAFVRALGQAFVAGDATNRRALRKVFAHYFDDYLRTWVAPKGGA